MILGGLIGLTDTSSLSIVVFWSNQMEIGHLVINWTQNLDWYIFSTVINPRCRFDVNFHLMWMNQHNTKNANCQIEVKSLFWTELEPKQKCMNHDHDKYQNMLKNTFFQRILSKCIKFTQSSAKLQMQSKFSQQIEISPKMKPEMVWEVRTCYKTAYFLVKMVPNPGLQGCPPDNLYFHFNFRS